MAVYLPQASGLWTTTTWITALTNLTAFAGVPPISADDVYADGKTITINTNINVASLRTTTAPRTGGAAGGGFRATNNTSLTANLLAGTTTCLSFNSAAPNFFTLYGNVTGSATAGQFIYGLDTVGIANVFGFARGQNGNSTSGAGWAINSTNTINFVGSLLGSSFSNNGYALAFTNVANITGTILGCTPAFQGASVGPQGTNATLNMVGDINFLNSSGGAAIITTFCTNSIINLSGSIIKGTKNGVGISLTNTNTLNITGDITQGGDFTNNVCIGVDVAGGTLNVRGNVYGQTAGGFGGGNASGNAAINIAGTGVVNVNGNVFGGTGDTSFGMQINGSGIANINGNVFGSRTVNSGGIRLNTGTARLIVNGGAFGSITNGVINSSSSYVYITRVVGASGGPTAPGGGTSAGLFNSQNGLAYAEEIEFGAQGASPVSGPVFMVNRPNSVVVMRGPSPTFASTTLFGNLAIQGLFPPVSSVRFGISYGNGDFVGTMTVPPRDAVQIGVPVDDTTGTFVLSPESFWTIKRGNSALNDPTTIGYRIKNLATIASVGKTLASFNLSGFPGQY